MIKISHRGNLNGPNPLMENKPEYIEKAIEAGFDCEIDLWLQDWKFYLGHDQPEIEIKSLWLINKLDKLWIHCKNLGALSTLKGSVANYFYHQNDNYTLTSKGYIWTLSGSFKNEDCIVVNNSKKYLSKNCLGVCSDYINLYE